MLNVSNSPLSQEQAELFNRLIETLSEFQKIWLSGYLAGSAQLQGTLLQSSQAGAAGPEQGREVTILYGSQSGNSKGIAKKAGKLLEEKGFQVKVSSMHEFKLNQLKKVQTLLIVVSTHGEGDPPDQAVLFHEFLHSKRAPKLDGLQYSVLALGDSSYEFFCQTGKEMDLKLEELGATRMYPRVDCDVDFDESAEEWINGVLGILQQSNQANNARLVIAPQASLAFSPAESSFSRTNPFAAEVLENINLNGRGSEKETRHLELSLEGSGITYEPGDSLGIYPNNDPELVERLLDQLRWDPETLVTVNKQGDVRTFRDALTSYYEITVLTKPLIEKAAQWLSYDGLYSLLAAGHEGQLKAYIEGRDLLDFVRDYGPWGNSPQEFVSLLRRIPARLYSIASSLSAHPETVHLTIGAVRYEAHGRKRKGVCSTLVAERVQPGDRLSVFVQPNENFKLPKDPNASIIMIGPGTGVAPFRAFLQEREEQGAAGKSWLFFGNPHFMTDFLYQTEWTRWLKEGVLTRMDVAFSRDTKQKVYVQHRMLERSRELYEWLQEGAAVYICGDEKRMARDVHHTLIEIVEKEGGMSRDQAEKYVAELQQQQRCQRDVY